MNSFVSSVQLSWGASCRKRPCFFGMSSQHSGSLFPRNGAVIDSESSQTWQCCCMSSFVSFSISPSSWDISPFLSSVSLSLFFPLHCELLLGIFSPQSLCICPLCSVYAFPTVCIVCVCVCVLSVQDAHVCLCVFSLNKVCVSLL